MFRFIRNLLFLMPAEKAHYFTMQVFKICLLVPGVKLILWVRNNVKVVDGLTYKNGVGLAAGFDKDGKFVNELYHLGFGFIEVGTVTPKPQEGNPKPRLFRLKKDEALINRMGFNNEGLEALKSRLKSFREAYPRCNMQIGINIGKNKNTPNESAVDDYVECYKNLYEYADFFVVNVSSPNTPGLRELQNKDELKKILSALLAIRAKNDFKPLYLKIAPDLHFDQLDEIIELQKEIAFEGIVATNTSIDRSLIQNTSEAELEEIGNGGLSGAPVLDSSNSFVKHIRTNSTMTIIGVGGINSVASAKSKYDAGANLIEIYTGFIYKGPRIIKKLARL